MTKGRQLTAAILLPKLAGARASGAALVADAVADISAPSTLTVDGRDSFSAAQGFCDEIIASAARAGITHVRLLNMDPRSNSHRYFTESAGRRGVAVTAAGTR